jgi:uncharacterized protein YbgA (DUF1722 family)
MAGFIGEQLNDPERRELDRVIRRYGDGEVPLAVPVSLLRLFHLRAPDGYGARQLYARPHPEALGLYGTI